MAATGVPLIRPLDPFNDKPFGNTPEVMLQVYGVVPPVAVKVAEYAAPTWPLGRDVVEMVRILNSMFRVNLRWQFAPANWNPSP